IADKGYDLAPNTSEFFFDREDVAQNLTRMLVVGQRVDCWHAGEFGEFLDIALRVRPNHSAVNHAPEDARGVFDQFAATKLSVRGIEIKRIAAELTNSHFKRHACARGRLGKNQSP